MRVFLSKTVCTFLILFICLNSISFAKVSDDNKSKKIDETNLKRVIVKYKG